MKRLFTWLKAVFNRIMYGLEDPVMMLDQWIQETAETQRRNRELAVQAITQRNNLAAQLERVQAQIKNNEAQAMQALKSGNRELARTFAKELSENQEQLKGLQASLAQANTAVENVKKAISRHEDMLRQKKAEVMRMKAEYKSAKAQNAINKALEAMTFEGQDQTFDNATEKIQEEKSQALARGEMLNESLVMKAAELQDQAADAEADNILSQLEANLGLAPSAPAQEKVTVGVSTGGGVDTSMGEADAALSELESRLQK